MNATELDFRYDWISVTLGSLESGFKAIQEKAAVAPWFDGHWQMEYAQNILGIAFVVAQNYIFGTVEDVHRIRESAGKGRVSKIDVYSDSPLLSKNVSSVLLVNSIANYYKHHDEWDVWPTNLTGEVLANFGIGKDTEFPCYVAAAKLWGENDIENLKELLKIISVWREYILSRYR